MFSKSVFLALSILPTLCVPVLADSLGFRFADVETFFQTDENRAQTSGRLSAAFALTEVHGLQLDLGVVSYDGGYLGQIDAHLYMMPTEAAKYGVYFSLADLNDREATIGVVGVEAMFALTDRTEVHGRAGIGLARPDSLDFVTASLGASHAMNDSVSVFADLTVADFDESGFSALASTVQIGLRYQPPAMPWEIDFSLQRDGLTGRDAAPFETRVALGFTWHLGASSAGAKRGLDARGFDSPQPFDPLVRRGLF